MKIAVYGIEKINFPKEFDFEIFHLNSIDTLIKDMKESLKKYALAIIQIGKDSKEAVKLFKSKSVPYVVLYNETQNEDVAWYLKNGAEYIVNHSLQETFNIDILSKYLKNEDVNEYKVFFELTKILRLNLDLKTIIFEIKNLIRDLFDLKTLFIVRDKYYYDKNLYETEEELLDENIKEKNFLEYLISRDYFFPDDHKEMRTIVLPIIDKNEVLGRVIFYNKTGVKKRAFELLNVILSQTAVVIKNYFLLEESKNLYYGMVKALVNAIEAKDEYTRGHTSRVAELSLKVGRKLYLSVSSLEKLEIASFLHDVGKIGVKDEILNKRGKLTLEEYNEIKKHPDAGYKIVSEIEDLWDVANIIRTHHERWDGKGYPKGLKEKEIPVEARIISIVDTYDALTSERPYRVGTSHKEAIEEIKRAKGTQFDPKITTVFIELMEELELIS